MSFIQSLSGSEFLMSNLPHCISAFWHLACNVPCQVPTTATTSTCNLYLLLFFFSLPVSTTSTTGNGLNDEQMLLVLGTDSTCVVSFHASQRVRRCIVLILNAEAYE